MPPDLVSTALAELEQIIAQLNLDNDALLDALSESELEMSPFEPSADLTDIKIIVPPKK
jgi:hypothetical protein